MSEKEQKAGAEKGAAKGKEKGAEKTQQELMIEQRRESKAPWTLERCMKAAKRFVSKDEWKSGFPSSYKAAVAHGWEKECSAHMKNVSRMGKGAPKTTKKSGYQKTA